MKKSLRYLNIAIIFGVILSVMPGDIFAHKLCKRPPKKDNCQPPKKEKCHKDKQSNEAVDYIVIGSCAGGVVARRLSDDCKTSVLLLEAGDNNNTDPILVDSADAATAYLQKFPEFDYQARGAIQPQLNGGFYDWLVARIFGGGSSHNGMQMVRCSPQYWRDVANIVGNDWSVDKVFARYKALETYQNDGPGVAGPSRGTKGPWKNVTTPPFVTPDAEYIVQAFEDMSGLPQIQDYNDPQTPFGPFARWDYQERFDLPNYPRESVAFGFLGPDVIDRHGKGVFGRKLEVRVRSTAVALLWDEHKENKVIGVRYSYNGKFFDVYANKEVIVSAGALSSSFLQRNGIGPSEVLRKAGVKPRILNEHVGQHMVNHVGIQATFSAPGINVYTPESSPWAIFGPGAFLPTQLPVQPGALNQPRQLQWISVDGSLFGANDLLIVFPFLVQPQSEGTINIQDNDPFKIPLMDNGYLTNLEDEQTIFTTFREGVLALNDFFAANPAPSGGTWQLISPTLDVIEDDALFDSFIRNNLAQAFHYACTCRMGRDRSTSVVDSRGRVHGTKGLRVADVSILPQICDGNTCTPAVLTGWTISEFILEDNRAKRSR